MLEGNSKIFSIKQNPILNEKVNNQIIRLIRDKVIPLNKSKYAHLQKIHCTSRNNSSQIPILVKKDIFPLKQQQEDNKQKVYSARQSYKRHGDSIMNNQLKKLKYLKINSEIINSHQNVGACWEKLRNSIIKSDDFSKLQHSQLTNNEKKNIFQNSFTSRRRKQNLMQLATRAEDYLRIKKRQLQQRYCREQQYGEHKREVKQSQLQRLMNKFLHLKTQKTEKMNNHILQKQLLKQIRLNMKPNNNQNIKRIKKQSNHKKLLMLK